MVDISNLLSQAEKQLSTNGNSANFCQFILDNQASFQEHVKSLEATLRSGDSDNTITHTVVNILRIIRCYHKAIAKAKDPANSLAFHASLATIHTTIFTALANTSALPINNELDVIRFKMIAQLFFKILQDATVENLEKHKEHLSLIVKNLIYQANLAYANLHLTEDTQMSRELDASLFWILDGFGNFLEKNKASSAANDFINIIETPLQEYFTARDSNADVNSSNTINTDAGGPSNIINTDANLTDTISIINTHWRKPALEDKIALLNQEIEELQEKNNTFSNLAYQSKKSNGTVSSVEYDEKNGAPTTTIRGLRGPSVDAELTRAKTMRNDLKEVLTQTDDAIATAQQNWNTDTDNGTNLTKCDDAKRVLLKNICTIEQKNTASFNHHRREAASWLKAASCLLVGAFVLIFTSPLRLTRYADTAKELCTSCWHNVQRKTDTQSRMSKGTDKIEETIAKSTPTASA